MTCSRCKTLGYSCPECAGRTRKARNDRPVFQLPTPPLPSTGIFAEQTQEKADYLAVEHAQALNAYIAAYLVATGVNIQDLVLMEQRFYTTESITTKYWLEPRATDQT